MGTHTPTDLLKGWRLKELTTEMAIGHLIQNLLTLETALTNINITLYNLRADVDSLIAHTGLPPNPKGRQRPPKKS